MTEDRKNKARLEVAAEVSFLPVVTSFVEKAATVFGLGSKEGLEITLAAEEVFVYTARSLCPGAAVLVEAEGGIYYIRLTFRLPVSELNLKALNVTSSVSLDGGEGMDEMGLIIATRFVDRLNVSRLHHREVRLDLIKEKQYEPFEGGGEEKGPPSGTIRVIEPDAEAATRFAAMACRAFQEPLRPPFFRYPGKVADMAASREYRLLIAVDEKARPAGGLMFYHRTERVVQFYGPYVLAGADRHGTAQILTGALISRIARTKTIGVVSHNVPEGDLLGDFEELGVMTFARAGASPLDIPLYYRLLHEDPGGGIWTHEDLLPFLEAQYNRLVLARDISIFRDHGESPGDRSIFSSDVEAGQSRVMLQPIWSGSDVDENLAKHVETFQRRGILNIFCTLDLGVPWHSRVMPPLLARHFTPQVIVPFAGTSDLVVFQHHAPAA